LPKRFFVPKKAKTQNAFNIGLAKNRRMEVIELLFAILLQFRLTEQNLAGKRSMNIGLII